MFEIAEERRAQGQKRRRLENDRRARETKMFNPNGPNFGDMTAAPVNDPNAGMSNAEIVANRAQIRLANINAAAALRAQLSGEAPPVQTTEVDDSETKGTKRKLDETDSVDDENEDENSQEDDMDSTYEDAEAQGKAILKRVADEKKQKEEEARNRVPGDEVR